MQDALNFDPAYHRDIFRVTDEMRRASLSSEGILIGEMSDTLGDACKALTKSIDNGLPGIFRTAAGITNQPEMKTEAHYVVKDLAKFAEFLEFERSTFISCGVSEFIAEQLVQDIARMRDRLYDLNIDPDATMAAIEQCRSDVCIAAHGLREAIADRKSWIRFRRNALIISGLAIGLANAFATIPTGGVATPLTVLSMAAGSAIAMSPPLFED